MKTCGKSHHDTLGIVVNCSEETPCRDCLLAEVGRLEYMVQSLQGEQAARSAPVAAEVPDLTATDLEDLARSLPSVEWCIAESDPVAHAAYSLAVSRIRPLPSNRVLKDGMIQIAMDDLREAISAIMCSVPVVTCEVDYTKKCQRALDRLLKIELDAFRSQRTENEGSNHHASN